MMDEIFDRTYQAGRADLNDGLDAISKRVSKTVLGAFQALNRAQFNAPWRGRANDTGCA